METEIELHVSERQVMRKLYQDRVSPLTLSQCREVNANLDLLVTLLEPMRAQHFLLAC